MKSLVYISVFLKKDYINLLNLLFESLIVSRTDLNNIDILVITQNDFKCDIKKISEKCKIDIEIKCLDFWYSKYKKNRRKTQKKYIDILDASQMSLRIFELVNLDLYEKILYLDADVLVLRDLNEIFNIQIKNKLYAEQQSNIKSGHHGSMFFDFTKMNKNTPAFCAGILLFKNCNEIKELFKKTLKHIKEHIISKKPIPMCVEQPFLVYNTIMCNLYDCKLTKKINGDGQILKHFQNNVGDGQKKYNLMLNFLANHKKTMEMETSLTEEQT